MRIAVVGCGAVAERYASTLASSSLSLAATCDVAHERAVALAAPHEATPYDDLDAMLAVESVPLVVNLTSHAAHADVTRRCLDAGRHVYSEKPLALDADEARELLDRAAGRDLALGCAPINHRCEAQRRVREALADGRLGTVRLAYAHAHVGRVTEWHDHPASFLAVGPLYDGAVYPLNLLVDWFGPVARVRTADAASPWPDRESQHPERASHVETTLEFAAGPLVRLTASLYAPHRSREFNSLELHGDDGSLYLRDAGDLGDTDRPGTGDFAVGGSRSPDARHRTPLVSFGRTGRAYTPMPPQRPASETPYLDGPERLATSVEVGRPSRSSARRAAHLVAICNAVETAAESATPVAVDDYGVTARLHPGLLVRPELDRSRSSPSSSSVPSSSAPSLSPSSPSAPSSSAPRPSLTGQSTSIPIYPRTAALRLPPVGLGCSRYRDGEYVERRESIEVALDAGYRLLDSAELYGNEGRIGEILAAPGSPDREALFLVSKVWNTNHGHVAQACETTLDALGIDALDCYMVHWPEAWAYQGPLERLADLPVGEQERLTFPEDDDGNRLTADVPLEETWGQMEDLYDRGLARTLGVCNVDRETLVSLVDDSRVPPAIVQVERHPFRPRRALVEYCHVRGIRVVAHSPLSAPGLLDDPTLVAVARAHGVSPAQVVLAWNVGCGVVPIPSSTDPGHVVENLAGATLRLDAQSMRRIDDLVDPEFER